MLLRAMLKRLFPSTLYVRVKANEFEVRHIESQRSCRRTSTTAFTSRRLLIAEFVVAETLLKECFRELLGSGLRVTKPSVLIHPLDMTEGGLSGVEERVLLEVADGAGGNPVKIWVGEVLSDREVEARLRDA